MNLQPGVSYHYSRDGQQHGPAEGSQIVQMAQAGQILATDYLWAEGMDDWLPATAFPELAAHLGPREARAPAVVERGLAGGSELARTQVLQATPMRDTVPALRQPPAKTPSNAATALAGRPAGRGPTGRKASFGPLLGSFIAFFATLTIFLGFSVALPDTSAMERGEELSGFARLMLDHPIIPIGFVVIILVSGLLYGILSLVVLYKAWASIQDLPRVTTSPGKAVGFLFIPFFNIVWMFFAFYKWAVDYNRRKASVHGAGAPPASEALFLTHCILALLNFPLLHIFLMHQMCRGINHIGQAAQV